MGENKNVLITGAARGIGRATAILFAEMGYNTVINCKTSLHEALELAKELSSRGLSAMTVQGDVTNRVEVQAMLQRIETVFGGVDILVNNAGISQQKLFTDISAEDWQNMLAVNLTGVFNCTQAVLPHMISQKSGSIVNVSSIYGMSGASCEVHYSTTKAGVIGMTKALALELAPSGIRVNCVAPGVIDTDMNAMHSPETMEMLRAETPLGKIGSPDNIARSIVFLACEDSAFTTGQTLSPNGGMVI